MGQPLAGKVALVAGATRGAGRGIAVELGAAGATVYVTGRTARAARSEMNRPETIEETAALVDAAGGRGIAVRVDHLVPDEVESLPGHLLRRGAPLPKAGVEDEPETRHEHRGHQQGEADTESGLCS